MVLKKIKEPTLNCWFLEGTQRFLENFQKNPEYRVILF
jgi:hypothetical protein